MSEIILEDEFLVSFISAHGSSHSKAPVLVQGRRFAGLKWRGQIAYSGSEPARDLETWPVRLRIRMA
jgi:hypothetical protein